MPWCAMACIESVMKYIQKSEACEAVSTAKLLCKPYWENLLPDSIPEKLDKVFNTNYVSKMPIKSGTDEEYIEKYKEFEKVVLEDFGQYEGYFKYEHTIESSNKYFKEQISSLFYMISVSNTWYGDSKSKRYRSMRNAIESKVCRILFIENAITREGMEDSNHTILIDGYTEDGLLVIDSNNLTNRRILVRMLKDTEEMQIAYSPSYIYKIDSILHIITTTSEVNNERIDGVLDYTEYRVISHVLNSIERLENTNISLSNENF